LSNHVEIYLLDVCSFHSVFGSFFVFTRSFTRHPNQHCHPSSSVHLTLPALSVMHNSSYCVTKSKHQQSLLTCLLICILSYLFTL